MFYVTRISFTIFLSLSSFIYGAIEYRLASLDDIDALVNLINTKAINDRDKIVIVPKSFRRGALEGSIRKGRLFVALNSEEQDSTHNVIAFKKLFCITDAQERQDILRDELRCLGNSPVNEGIITHSPTYFMSARVISAVNHTQSTYIYNGGDFTDSDFRERGINAALTEYALQAIKGDIISDIRTRNSAYLIMAYGLTRANAGDNFLDGRTKSIVETFKGHADSVALTLNRRLSSSIFGGRYTAFMPTFDPDATQCIPLSDDRSISGYGYLLAYPLVRKKNELNVFRIIGTVICLGLLYYTGFFHNNEGKII